MYKFILAAVTISVFSQPTKANNQELWQCVDSKTLSANEQCVASTIANHIDNKEFFSELAHKNFNSTKDAFSTITHYPKKQLIEVKSIEVNSQKDVLIVSKR